MSDIVMEEPELQVIEQHQVIESLTEEVQEVKADLCWEVRWQTAVVDNIHYPRIKRLELSCDTIDLRLDAFEQAQLDANYNMEAQTGRLNILSDKIDVLDELANTIIENLDGGLFMANCPSERITELEAGIMSNPSKESKWVR